MDDLDVWLSPYDAFGQSQPPASAITLADMKELLSFVVTHYRNTKLFHHHQLFETDSASASLPLPNQFRKGTIDARPRDFSNSHHHSIISIHTNTTISLSSLHKLLTLLHPFAEHTREHINLLFVHLTSFFHLLPQSRVLLLS